MQTQPPFRGYRVILGSLGYSLGAIVGNLSLLFLFWARPFRHFDSISESQPLIRLVTIFILVILSLVISGAIKGLFGGLFLGLGIEKQFRRRLVAGSILAFGTVEGLLIVPFLFVLAFISLYNNGASSRHLAIPIIITFFGLLYGLISGVILGLFTVNWRRSWLVILATSVGFALGAYLFGYVFWNSSLTDVSLFTALQLAWRLVVLVFLLNAPGGGFLGLAFTFLFGRYDPAGPTLIAPRGQRMAVAITGLILLITITSLHRQIIDFITVRPSNDSPQLTIQTTGVQWGDVVILPANPRPIIGQAPTIAVSPDNKLALGWIAQTGDRPPEVFYLEQDLNATAGPDLAPVRLGPGAGSPVGTAPQIVYTPDGTVHALWLGSQSGEEKQVYYATCLEGICQPAITISDPSGLACASGELGPPALAVDQMGNLMAVWTVGGQPVFSTWGEDTPVPTTPAGCLPPGPLAENSMPALAGGSDQDFIVAFTSAGRIHAIEYHAGNWEPNFQYLGDGRFPRAVYDADNLPRLAWCGSDGALRSGVTMVQPDAREWVIPFPPCSGHPGLALDGLGKLHVTWYSTRIRNAAGQDLTAEILYESILQEQGWSDAVMVARLPSAAYPSLSTGPDGAIHLAWSTATGTETLLQYAYQPSYVCAEDSLDRLEKIVYQTIIDGDFYNPGTTLPFCGNKYDRMIFTPNPDPAYYSGQVSQNGGFDRISELILQARYEVLFATMQVESDENGLSPGAVLAQGVKALYDHVRNHPEAYPRGMTVRILLGNYPEVANLEWGDQIWNVLSNLRAAGLPAMVDPEIGWRVQVANYPGVFPHSHTKFVIIDGAVLVSSGFNYGYLHYGRDHPSGRGDNLTDLGLQIEGPIAQTAIAAYDDMWSGAEEIYCADLYPPMDFLWTQGCQLRQATADHSPEVMRYHLSDENLTAFSLFRNAIFKEGDATIAEVITNAQDSIDLLQANFSLDLICALNVLVPDFCTINDAPEYMNSVLAAIENGARVRVLVETSGMNGLENRIAFQALEDELLKRGLEDQIEFRFFPGRVHAKAINLDNEFTIIGSQNLHYSAWGEGGLAEFNAGTNDPRAVDDFRRMFEFYWERGLPADDTNWTPNSP